MRRLALALLAVSMLAVGGCTSSSSSSSSAKNFQGTEADVAKVIADLQSAGQRKDAAKICSQILARSAVDELGSDCKGELDKAISDADEFSLSVRDVSVSGNEATATVRQGKDGPTKLVKLVKEGNSWKVSGLSNG
jgi:hypothetical protein